MFHLTKTFADQVSVGAYISDLFYIMACMGAFVVVLALALIDGGIVNPKHLVDTLAQKLISAFIAGAACMICGYGIWAYQFNQAFGVPNPLMQALSDWWLFGPNMNSYGQFLDPAAVPGAEVQQIFVVFFFAYAAVIGAFVHSMGLGRMKPAATYVMSAVAGGLMMPIMTYLTWGPVSPLSNNGVHDFVGAFSLYMFIGVWALILTWRLGPRLASTTGFNGHMFGSGAFLLMIAIPLFVMGCGFLEPGTGYFGITNTTSGLGIIFINTFMALAGGAISGGFIAYQKHKPAYVFLGPIAGYVSCSALFDIAAPWQCFVAACIGPWVMRGLTEVMRRMDLDDQKLVPVAFGPSVLSALLAGVIGSGIATGGMVGATGDYAFQHAHISFGMQCVGILVTLTVAGVSGIILVFGLEKTIGLRVHSTIEQDGMDTWYWNEWRKSRKMRISPKATAEYQG
jgi:Amt family ammonium transporter